MQGIEVMMVENNCNHMPIFLAKLTQRGNLISNMSDLYNLWSESAEKLPSKELLTLPHTTLKRMNNITVAITGLSTKAVSQLRTHATRLTFVSTSTQYSSYEERAQNYVMPRGLDTQTLEKMMRAYKQIQENYTELIEAGLDKDKASYLLPQGLRKTLIVHGNLDDWQYVLNLRLCRRNTEEVQYICKLIYNEIKHGCGECFVSGMLPNCVDGVCKEGKFCCGKPITKGEIDDNN